MLAVGVKGLHTMIDRVEKVMTSKFGILDVVIGNAADLYWKAPAAGGADFVRLRKMSNSSNEGQLTLKSTDKNDNVDRVEIDLDVDYKQAKVLMLALHGDPLAEVTKKYHVFFLDPHTTVSVYQIRDDDRVFVEVEAKNKTKLAQLISTVMSDSTEYRWVQSSVFNMFVEKRAMKVVNISKFLESFKCPCE